MYTMFLWLFLVAQWQKIPIGRFLMRIASAPRYVFRTKTLELCIIHRGAWPAYLGGTISTECLLLSRLLITHSLIPFEWYKSGCALQ